MGAFQTMIFQRKAPALVGWGEVFLMLDCESLQLHFLFKNKKFTKINVSPIFFDLYFMANLDHAENGRMPLNTIENICMLQFPIVFHV
jgi:hypothetical protein